jgi:hypothetical protein
MSRGYDDLTATFTVGAEAANAITVACQIKNSDGDEIAFPVALKWYWADDAAGLTPTATAHDGGTAAGTDGAIIESVANLSGTAVTEADGDLDIVATDAGVFTTYLVLVMPSGKLQISGAVTHA